MRRLHSLHALYNARDVGANHADVPFDVGYVDANVSYVALDCLFKRAVALSASSSKASR